MFDPTQQVFILSTDAAADACAEILDVQAVTVAEAGASLATLKGCKLVIWPSASPAAIQAAEHLATRLRFIGPASLKIVAPGALAAKGWDARAALSEGWGREDLLDWLRERAATVPAAAAANGHAGDLSTPESYGAIPPEPPFGAGPAADVRTEAEITGRAIPIAGAVQFDPAAAMADRWAMLGLETTKTGPICNEDNVLRVLERHPDLSALCWYDEFLGRIMTSGQHEPREWSDADDVRLTAMLQRDLGMARVKVSHIRAAIIGHAFSHVKNCAREWISAQVWDQTERIQHFFPDAFGTPDTPYARAVGRNFWISLVARVFQPGCKVDTMVILEGAQGARKSSVLKAIAGEWFTVQHESITGKGFFEVLQGKMLVEIAEMDAFGKAEVTRVKQVVSTETDRYRESYGRYAKDHPRHSIFVGTTNKDDWNRDETGARRFWPIQCVGTIDTASVAKARCQLFAEALSAYRLGTDNPAGRWWETPDVETTAEQDRRREEETWEGALTEWLDEPYKITTTIRHALWGSVNIEIGDQSRYQINRMTAALKRLGWRKVHTATGNLWCRPENEPSDGSAQ